jgi:hypothetical protein
MPSYRSVTEPDPDDPEEVARWEERREAQRADFLSWMVNRLEADSAAKLGISVEAYRARKRQNEQALLERADRDWAAWKRGEWGASGTQPPPSPPGQPGSPPESPDSPEG